MILKTFEKFSEHKKREPFKKGDKTKFDSISQWASDNFKFDIGSTLSTMVDGDDMDFEPMDPDDTIFTLIGFKANEEDPMEWANNLSKENATRVGNLLKDKGYLEFTND